MYDILKYVFFREMSEGDLYQFLWHCKYVHKHTGALSYIICSPLQSNTIFLLSRLYCSTLTSLFPFSFMTHLGSQQLISHVVVAGFQSKLVGVTFRSRAATPALVDVDPYLKHILKYQKGRDKNIATIFLLQFKATQICFKTPQSSQFRDISCSQMAMFTLVLLTMKGGGNAPFIQYLRHWLEV